MVSSAKEQNVQDSKCNREFHWRTGESRNTALLAKPDFAGEGANIHLHASGSRGTLKQKHCHGGMLTCIMNAHG
ncbi:hypothetical protein TNCV_3276511 [Trichonephila clavipes]|nr:hypothetical protein TNCV_3276511 [Trichonephila clavipes]